MNDTEKITMHLHIGGSQLPVSVPLSEQELVRDVESQLDKMYTSWRHDPKFAKRSDRDILAMVAYKFAFHYNELLRRYDEASRKTRSCLEAADRILDPAPADNPADDPDA